MYAIPNVMNKVLPLLAVIDAYAAANAADIVTNAADIVTNAEDIVANAEDIVTNAQAIAALEAAVAAGALGDVPVTVDSESQTLVIDHAYLAQTSGYVTAWIAGQYNLISGFVGTTTDPAGAGQPVGEARGYCSSPIAEISFFVGSGKYFEITSTGTPTITWTPLITGGDAPIDAN